MDDERELIGTEVWVCMTIYTPANTEEEAALAVSTDYAGSLEKPDTLDMLDGVDIPLEGEDFISSAITLYGLADDSELLPTGSKAELERLRAEKAMVLSVIEEILPGCIDEGRWLGPDGEECEEHDEGADWYRYTEEEQTAWLASVGSSLLDLRTKLETQ
ncbi:protein of unknown function [Pseudorhizobium banfieldiae]|uniref:Uncharacterized protein n=1 Tax=Pseudorhizobium banfieldiae TaxID=1125847 RepID=L0NFR1_9HYPH|nr:hypothetical protein [Pseudorhizobium banfieldiae]CAD6606086.1 hypothetical protein RNT25_01781 [arsenite-oxidising bacterium NT-25]CCF19127.1 protein of unknown function [Pseudorhizobium banfieldiae]